MDAIKGWSAAVMCAAVVCAVAQMLVPNEKRKLIGIILGLFMLAVMIEPAKDLNLFIKNIDWLWENGQKTQVSDDLLNYSNKITVEEGGRAVERVIEQKLADFGVRWKKIEVNCWFSEQDNVINISSVSIQLDKSFGHRKVQIEEYIQNETGLTAEVILI